MSRLWLLRHAQPLIEPGICYGRLDVEADAAATLLAARQMHRALPVRCVLRHSPLRRCLQLARALQELRPDSRLHPDTRLQEMDFGSWEGKAWDAIGPVAVGEWAGQLAHHAPGGGESLAAMLERVGQALDDARAQAQGGIDIAWITHAGVARCAQWLLDHGKALPGSDQWTLAAPAPGGWMWRQLA
ncbi:MAG: histidine phosphatase family protein [Burkholderiaceae bacterium]|jgi:alpha-ribazole phosphatase|nr:histidine phosphatase family protein [Burkholderiaceae bacterium]